jgi:single-stranded-DNA-specific exonuclease
MQYNILHDDKDQPLLERLLQIRNVTHDVASFLDPQIKTYRHDPHLLYQMDIAVARIIQAIKNNEKIMIFGDYDVDGVTSSKILYSFIRRYLKYDQVSIMFPHRRLDGYGIKNKHIDIMKEKGIRLIITVDNGITSIAEAAHAKSLGIDMIITDHHKNLETLPDVVAIINPHVSPEYPFNGLCGAGVAFKLVNAIMAQTSWSSDKKREVFQRFLPIVAIATVADCVPLIDENRAMVRR